MDYANKIAGELNIQPKQASATIELLEGGGTVPFISRYRKEATGSLDEMVINQIKDRLHQLKELDKRRETILKTIEEQGNLTDDLRKQINAAETMAALEDLYLPYKPKKRTKATIAKEKGLENLAKEIFKQEDGNPEDWAQSFINAEKQVNSVEEALEGARHIIAEWVNENQEARQKMRKFFWDEGIISSRVLKGKESEGQKYKDYFEWQEPVKKAPSHRILAMRRGEKEMILAVDIAPDEEMAVQVLEGLFLEKENEAAHQVKMAVKDGYKRLMKPSIETDIRMETKKQADLDAINVFSENLQQLLLSAPLGEKRTMAIDPGFRTGCKLVCLDAQGALLHHSTIFPNEPQKKVEESSQKVKDLCNKFQIESIAIGNGTASRETEKFVRDIDLPEGVDIVMVSESGASVYSASEAARNELGDYDVTVRGAVSIGRRLMDPLAELVKIDPKSIGVGQYQHDVDQNQLKKGLDETVISCVNRVGVEVNTASKELLTYVSGLGPSLAKKIIEHRNEYGPFKDRFSLKKVSGMGEKAFEQSAGFLRIQDSQNPLDRSAVHPERYETVEKMAKDLNCTVQDLVKDKNLRQKIDLKSYVSDDFGLPTLQDIMVELEKPGRDPREAFEAFQFSDEVHEVKDLKPGMKLPGIVTNITNFGAFVDIGVHQDGLVHISHMADKYVSDPAQVVKVHQTVNVTVVDVDVERKRIALSMKKDPFAEGQEKKESGNASKSSTSKEAPKAKGGKKGQKSKEDQGEDFHDKLSALKGKFK